MKRYADLAQRNNTIQQGEKLFDTIKNNWNTVQFKNKNPITLELACGNGEYTLGLAHQNKNKNFIGIDLKGGRIWVGSGRAIEEGLGNVAFLRTNILTLENLFSKDEVDEIWLVFPDPRPKVRDEKRRLSSPRFLDIYKAILKPNGWLRFKTDNTDLFNYTLTVLASRTDIKELKFTEDVYNSPLNYDHYGIITKYEKKFSEEGKKIKYLKFKFK